MALEQEHHGSKVILDVIEIDFLKSDEKSEMIELNLDRV
jgi:hypothetical protein